MGISKKEWNAIFLGLTGIVVSMEIFAGLGHNPNIRPWTSIFIDNFKMRFGFPIVCIFAVWLVHHFWYWYNQNRK